MADSFDASRRVHEIPAGPEIKPFERHEGAIITPGPDVQSAASNYAAATNWMSALGSKIADTASEEMAKKLGTEAGKNPTGDLTPPITNFDKHFAQAYYTQSEATLSNQANKLMSDADIEMSKAPRLTPDLIAKNNQQLALGLKNISSNAPDAVREKLDYQFNNLMIRQNHQLQTKMIKQQHAEAEDTLLQSYKDNTVNALNFAISGNQKAADELVKQTKESTEINGSNGTIDKLKAHSNYLAVKQAAINGMYINKALTAWHNNQLEEYYTDLVTKDHGLTPTEHASMVASVNKYMKELTALKDKQEQVDMLDMKNKIVEDPFALDHNAFEDYRKKVSPKIFAETELYYQRELLKRTKEKSDISAIRSNWNNANYMANAPEAGVKAAFYDLAAETVNNSNGQIDFEQAQMTVAANAAVPVKPYINYLNGRAHSGNPQDLEYVNVAMNYFQTHDAGDKLIGLTDESKAIISKYNDFKRNNVPFEAAKMARELVVNKKDEQKKANQIAWTDYLHKQKGSMSTDKFVFKTLDIPKDAIVRDAPGIVSNAMDKFHNYFDLLDGDVEEAKKRTNEDFASSYGITNINGTKEYVFAPIEKVTKMPLNGMGAIQEDIYEQLQTKFSESKKNFDEGKSDFYYELLPRQTAETVVKLKQPATLKELHQKRTNLANILARSAIVDTYNQGAPLVVYKNWRAKEPEKYELALRASSVLGVTTNADHPIVGGYDVLLKTPKSSKPLFMNDPINDHISVVPNIKNIQKKYLLVNGHMSNLQEPKKLTPGEVLSKVNNNLRQNMDYNEPLFPKSRFELELPEKGNK